MHCRYVKAPARAQQLSGPSLIWTGIFSDINEIKDIHLSFLTSLKEDFTIKSACYTYIFGLAMKIIAFIVLLSHINFSMFIAQIDEVDVFDKSGQQREDINSLVEYLANTFHIKHKPIKDSDDDNARYFHVVKLPNCIIPQPIVAKEDNFNFSDKSFPLYIEKKLISVSLDIQGPPPKV